MCTAICVTNKNFYFGRNLDYEHTFGEKVTITPRFFPFCFLNGKVLKKHYAVIGMALPYSGYPLYFDATNEMGLSIAGLNFPDNAKYEKCNPKKDNVASFEFIPWILSQCATINEARALLCKINITDEPISATLAPTPLHWLIADKENSLTVEQTHSGLKVYENPVGVLTNNPTFDVQMFNLSNYMNVSSKEPQNRFSHKIELNTYSRGMGGLGLPGDLSSMSRFVRASFTKLNSIYGNGEEETVNQFFHILYSVYQQKGCVVVGDSFEITNYSSCCNADEGIYYYTTYNNHTVRAVNMHKENLDTDKLITFNISQNVKFNMQN